VGVPAPLLYLLAAVLLVTLTWAFVVPPWRAPDEDDHFAYVQSVGEGLGLPGEFGRRMHSTEHRLARRHSQAEQDLRLSWSPIERSEAAHRGWEDADLALSSGARRDGGGPSAASTNPPLYYLCSALPYRLASTGDVFDRLYAARALSATWLLVTVVGAWLLAGEVFGPRRTLQLSAASVTGLAPMTTFVSGSLNPDSMLYATWAIGLWLGTRVLRRGLTVRRGVAFFAVVGVGTLVKATTLVMIPSALLVLAVGVTRLVRRRRRPRAAASALAALAALAALGGAWVAAARLLDRPAMFQVGYPEGTVVPQSPVRLAASYLWQFYLPKLPFQQEFTGFPPLPVWDLWFKQAWGAFGLLEVELPGPLYSLLAALTAGVLAASLVAVLRARRAGRVDWAVAAFFALTTVSLVGGLHWTEYRLLMAGGGPFNQGRYLLPLLPLAGLAAAAALTLVPPRRRPAALGTGLCVLLALQTLSLGAVVGRFYG